MDSNHSHRVAALASQLRLIQEQFAEADPQVRQEELARRIDAERQSLPPDAREPFLRELAERFPAWEAPVEVTSPGEQTTTQSITDRAELQDWTFLLPRLISASARLSEADRKALIERLRESGLAPAAPASVGVSQEALAPIAKTLGVPPNKPIDPARALELTAVLIEVMVRLDEFAWKQWQQIAPQSHVRKPGNFKSDAARFVTAEQRAGDNSVAGDAKALQLLFAGMVQGVTLLGEELHHSVLSRFAPAEISRRAKDVKKFLETDEAASWRVYQEMSGQLERAALVALVREAIQKYVESTPGLRR